MSSNYSCDFKFNLSLYFKQGFPGQVQGFPPGPGLMVGGCNFHAPGGPCSDLGSLTTKLTKPRVELATGLSSPGRRGQTKCPGRGPAGAR